MLQFRAATASLTQERVRSAHEAEPPQGSNRASSRGWDNATDHDGQVSSLGYASSDKHHPKSRLTSPPVPECPIPAVS